VRVSAGETVRLQVVLTKGFWPGKYEFTNWEFRKFRFCHNSAAIQDY